MTYTASDAEALDYGFALPSGTDLIRGGDETIKQNAKAAAGGIRATLNRLEVNEATLDNLAATATTLEYGQPATVTVAGTRPAKSVHFGIPKGMPDSVGAQLVADSQAAAQQSTAAAADAAESLTLAQQAQAAAYEIPDQAWADMAGNPATLTGAVIREREASVLAIDHGLVMDGVSVNTTPLQAAIDAASAIDAETVVVIPAGWFKHGPLSIPASGVSLRGESDRSTILENTSTGPGITLGGATVGVASVHMADLTLRNSATGGHLIDVPFSLSQSRFERVRWISTNPASALLHCQRPEATGGVFDCVWDGGYYKMPTNSTIAGFHFVGAGSPANLLKWAGGRYEGCGTYFFHLEAGTGAYCYGNSWDGLNAEFPDHGFIRILSGLGNSINALGIQDSGTIAADLVYLGRATTSHPQTRGTTISGYNRSKGALSAGVVDIRCAAGGTTGSTTIVGATGPTTAGVTIDVGAGGGWATLLGIDSSVTVLNAQSRTVQVDPTAGLVGPKVTLSGIPILTGADMPEGVITAPVGALYLCTSVQAGLPHVWEKRAGTDATGWRPAGEARSLPSSSFTNATHYVNATAKYAGAAGFDTTAGRPVWASGGLPTSTWNYADGTTAHTPS